MKEYFTEKGKKVDLKKLQSQSFIPEDVYKSIHEHIVVFTSDVLVHYSGGFLLMKRTKNL